MEDNRKQKQDLLALSDFIEIPFNEIFFNDKPKPKKKNGK